MQQFLLWLENFKEYSSGRAAAIKNRIIDVSQRSREILMNGQTILESNTRIGYLKARQLVLKNADTLSITKHEKHALELYGDYLEFRELSNFRFPDEQPSALAEYCSTMSMSYSYKPVLICALINSMDANGGCLIDNLVSEIINFYAVRLQQGMIAEKSNSVFARIVSHEDAKRIILQNPVKALVTAGIVSWNKNENRIAFLPDYLPSSTHIEAVRNACSGRLDAYFQKLQEESPILNASNVYALTLELLNQIQDSALRSKLQECFDFVCSVNKISTEKQDKHTSQAAVVCHGSNANTRTPFSVARISDSDERKVGKLIKECMQTLSDSAYNFTEEQLINLLSAEWSKKTLGVYYPMFKEYDEHRTLNEQRVDHLGNGRYWNQIFSFNNRKFLITSEWYKQAKPLFIKWFNALP